MHCANNVSMPGSVLQKKIRPNVLVCATIRSFLRVILFATETRPRSVGLASPAKIPVRASSTWNAMKASAGNRPTEWWEVWFNSRFFPDFTCGRDYHRQDHSPHQQLWWIKGAGPCCFCWGEVKRFCTGWHFSGAHRLLRSLTSAANLHARIQATYSAQPKTSAPATFSIPPAGQFSFKHLKKELHLAVGKRTNSRNLNLYLCLCLYLYRQKRQKKT